MSSPTPAPDWTRGLDADAVLRGQGADAARVRERSPRLVEIAGRAAREGTALLTPRVVYRRLGLRSRERERLVLDNGSELTGPLIARYLDHAREIVALVATIGDRLETDVCRLFALDLPYALALDGLGSAAVEALALAAHGHFRGLAVQDGMRTTIPLSPGMEGWPLETGQRQIFGLLDAAPAGVHLCAEGMMFPRKSLSMVFGLGRHVRDGGRTCDHCAALDRCRHRESRGTPR